MVRGGPVPDRGRPSGVSVVIMTAIDPPRGLAERLRDTRARLEADVDLWVASSGDAGVHLIPLS